MLSDVGIGVCGNLATLVLKHQSEAFRSSIAGRAIAKMGLLDPSFDDFFEKSLKEAFERYYEKHHFLKMTKVVEFLSSDFVIKVLRSALFDAQPIDYLELESQLADLLDAKGLEANAWPIGIHPSSIVDNLLAEIRTSLLQDTHPALAIISSQIYEMDIQSKSLLTEIQVLKSDVVSLFNKTMTTVQDPEWFRFEQEYLEHLAIRYGNLSTPGARDLHGLSQSISVAYISLNLKSNRTEEPAKAEQFLKDNARIVIRGPAGSGKTTLLNYLIFSSSKQEDSNNIWAGGVPFFIPLRTVARVDAGPPSVDKFVLYSVDNEIWTLPAPAAWIHDVLRHQKRGIVMFDGIDELPSARRSGFWEWLARFDEMYPGNRIIITSRVLPGTSNTETARKKDEWNVPENFIQAHLEEMSDKDVSNFIEHWHNSIDIEKLEPTERSALTRARIELPRKLRDPGNRRIRELCSSPLLCAMVCVLHWREEGYLPRQRVELYERCCEMLIEARDLKRSIALPKPPLSFMTKNDKEMVLQKLSFEMMNNASDTDETDNTAYRMEVTRDKALHWLSPWILGFQQVKARDCTPSEVLDYLIERTGLVREPAGGLVDFPHRTFQEYLAACASGAEGKEVFLANKADDDQWHETITLAAGTTTGGVKFGHDLVEALLKRAERHKSTKSKSQNIRKTCFALALGCMENLRQPNPSLRNRVLARVDELVPPRDDSGAHILAVAGDAAVPHLSYVKWKDESTQTIAACAQALRLIGTTEAIKAMRIGYLDDRRDAVIAEVCKTGMFSFESIPYLSEYVSRKGELPHFAELFDLDQVKKVGMLKSISIKSNVPKNCDQIIDLPNISRMVADEVALEELPPVEAFTHIHAISLIHCKGNSYSWLGFLPNLKHLSISFPEGMQSLSWLKDMSRLEQADFALIDLENFSDIGYLKSMKRLSFFNCKRLSDLQPLAALPELAELRVANSAIHSLPDLQYIEVLDLMNANYLSNIGSLSDSQNLSSLSLYDCRSLSCLPNLEKTSIHKLSIVGLPDLTDLSALTSLTDLENLRLSGLPCSRFPVLESSNIKKLVLSSMQFADLDFLKTHNGIRKFVLSDCSRLENIDGLQYLTTLEEFAFNNVRRAISLEVLNACQNLRKVRFVNVTCNDIASSIAGIENIENLEILGCLSFDNISALSSLKNFKNLTIFPSEEIKDFTPLLSCEKLDRIIIDQKAAKESIIPEQLLTAVRDYHPHIYWDDSYAEYPFRYIHRRSTYYRGVGRRWIIDTPF